MGVNRASCACHSRHAKLMTSLLRMSRDIKSEVCAGKLKNRSTPTLAKVSVLVVRKDLSLLAFIVVVFC